MRLRYLESIKTFSDVIFLKNKTFELKSPKDEVDHQKLILYPISTPKMVHMNYCAL